jgi:S-adenosylmethionine synthetase
MRNIVIEKGDYLPVEERKIEIVERKGIGHPDTICDLVCESVSRALSQYYLKRFGKVLHHNLDKGLLVAGRSQPKFGGGRILEKIKIIVAGRATDKVGKFKIPVRKIAEKATKECLKRVVNSSKNIIENFEISIDYRPGAANLQEVFKRSKEVGIANDTSFGIGHGPYSRAEIITLKVANFLNSEKFLKKYPFFGTDIKVMTFRQKDELILTIPAAYIDRYIKNPKDYFEKKEIVKKEIERYVRKISNFKKIKIDHNTLDNPEAKEEGEIYLTVLGLSAEHGDDGQVGRGNRVSGLITPCREMSLEAAAGKNINHPGKLYQILAHLIAQEIGKIRGVRECSVRILSQIGKPLDQPQVASVKVIAKNFNQIKDKIYKLVDEKFNNLQKIQMEIVRGKYPIC